MCKERGGKFSEYVENTSTRAQEMNIKTHQKKSNLMAVTNHDIKPIWKFPPLFGQITMHATKPFFTTKWSLCVPKTLITIFFILIYLIGVVALIFNDLYEQVSGSKEFNNIHGFVKFKFRVDVRVDPNLGIHKRSKMTVN
jgi:hypothetical protein